MKTIDLFAGCGGMSLGFQNAGFDIVAAFDNWEPTIKIYEANFNHPIINLDLSQDLDYSVFSKYKPDIIVGGPPCQDFSSAGKRDEELGRADLTLSFAEIVANVKPHFFVMENVKRILKSKRLPEAIKIFRKAGYSLSSKVLDTSYCGVPQIRKRFIMVGELNGPDNVLSYYFENHLALKPMTIRDYFGKKLDFDNYYRHPRNYSRRAVYSVDEPSPTIRGVNRPVPKGYKGHPADSAPISERIRPLTTIERSYIQTFPPEFKWAGRKSDLEQMIGNAVPVKLAEFVANCIKQYDADKARGESYIKAKVAGVLVFDKKKK